MTNQRVVLLLEFQRDAFIIMTSNSSSIWLGYLNSIAEVRSLRYPVVALVTAPLWGQGIVLQSLQYFASKHLEYWENTRLRLYLILVSYERCSRMDPEFFTNLN